MATFTTIDSTVVPELKVLVLLNGAARMDFYCSSVSFGIGTAGSTASLSAPSLTWDGGKADYRGALVQVFAGYGSPETQIFSGYVNSTSGDTGGNNIDLAASSLIAMASNVYLGQRYIANSDHDLMIEYPRMAYRNGALTETGWTVKTILQDIFSSNVKTWRGGGGSFAPSWQSRLNLGSLDVLRSEYNNVTLGDLVFRQTTLADAIDQLLGIVGTITFRERFQGDAAWLDFFEIADPEAPTINVRVARDNEFIGDGANVLSVSHEESAEAVKTRLIGLGDRRRFIVSATTHHATAPLQRGWLPGLEASVLANTEGAKRSLGGNTEDEEEDPIDPIEPDTRSEFGEEKARVFRRYRIPECMRRLIVDSENAAKLSDGTSIPIQVWKIPRILSFNIDTGIWTSVLGITPTLLEGTQFDLEHGIFTLKVPAVNLFRNHVNGAGFSVDENEEAIVGITLTIAATRLIHDTGVRSNSMRFDGISIDGLTEIIQNDGFKYAQITNIGFPFLDSDGVGHTFIAYLMTDGWTLYESPLVVQNDIPILRSYTDMAIREKNAVKATYSVTTPFWTQAYRLGDRINVIGQDDFEFGTHQVMSLSYNLSYDHNVTFSTDSSVPLTASTILSDDDGGDDS